MPSSTAINSDEPVYGESRMGRVADAGAFLRARMVHRHVRKRRPATVMDIGCGYRADLLRELRPLIQTGIAVDFRIDPEVARMDGIVALEGPVEEALPRQDADSVDAVVALSVLEHLWEPAGVVAECHRVLRPSGALLVHVPTWLGRYALERIAFGFGIGKESINDHKRYYNKRELWPLLVRGGFEPKDIRIRYTTLGCTVSGVATKS
jgi:SAM-dependent methyltransferase